MVLPDSTRADAPKRCRFSRRSAGTLRLGEWEPPLRSRTASAILVPGERTGNGDMGRAQVWGTMEGG